MNPMLRLQPGDVVCYSGSSLFSRVIQAKTWSWVSHVEVVCRSGYVDVVDGVVERNWKLPAPVSVTSKEKGVQVYPFDFAEIYAILRPSLPFNDLAAWTWFERKAKGQPYDVLGMLAFTSAKLQGKDNGKMFCSEFCTRYLRMGNVPVFHGYDADGVAPGEFLKSELFDFLVPPPGREAETPLEAA